MIVALEETLFSACDRADNGDGTGRAEEPAID